jgi:hypothetical protein
MAVPGSRKDDNALVGNLTDNEVEFFPFNGFSKGQNDDSHTRCNQPVDGLYDRLWCRDPVWADYPGNEQARKRSEAADLMTSLSDKRSDGVASMLSQICIGPG